MQEHDNLCRLLDLELYNDFDIDWYIFGDQLRQACIQGDPIPAIVCANCGVPGNGYEGEVRRRRVWEVIDVGGGRNKCVWEVVDVTQVWEYLDLGMARTVALANKQRFARYRLQDEWGVFSRKEETADIFHDHYDPTDDELLANSRSWY